MGDVRTVMFPARAGMSRRALRVFRGSVHVPRASGDEPARVSHLHFMSECSPRERG